jgi:hypothetical protein
VWYSKGAFYHIRVLNVVFLLNNLRTADRGLYAAAAADKGKYTASASADRNMCRRRRSSSNTHNEGEPYYILKTNNPFLFWVPDGYDPDHFMPWVHLFTSVIAGPTGSGKSMLVRRFVHNTKHMMTPKPDRILRCYGEYQTFGTVTGIEFQQGLPDLDNLDPREKHLIILDDLMDGTHQRVFTKKSHHRNISVMYIVQNLFHHRTISLNAYYMVLFQNLSDVSQIMALAHQMYPRRTEFFLEAFARATTRPHGYIVIDMKQNTPDILRLRTFIFPGEEQKAYVES